MVPCCTQADVQRLYEWAVVTGQKACVFCGALWGPGKGGESLYVWVGAGGDRLAIPTSQGMLCLLACSDCYRKGYWTRCHLCGSVASTRAAHLAEVFTCTIASPAGLRLIVVRDNPLAIPAPGWGHTSVQYDAVQVAMPTCAVCDPCLQNMKLASCGGQATFTHADGYRYRLVLLGPHGD